jgi:hypothetical protein
MAEVLPRLYLHARPPATSQRRWSSSWAPARVVGSHDHRMTSSGRATPRVRRPVAGLGRNKSCLLVMIGVRADETKELVALSDGFRGSSESQADLLRD